MNKREYEVVFAKSGKVYAETRVPAESKEHAKNLACEILRLPRNDVVRVR